VTWVVVEWRTNRAVATCKQSCILSHVLASRHVCISSHVLDCLLDDMQDDDMSHLKSTNLQNSLYKHQRGGRLEHEAGRLRHLASLAFIRMVARAREWRVYQLRLSFDLTWVHSHLQWQDWCDSWCVRRLYLRHSLHTSGSVCNVTRQVGGDVRHDSSCQQHTTWDITPLLHTSPVLCHQKGFDGRVDCDSESGKHHQLHLLDMW